MIDFTTLLSSPLRLLNIPRPLSGGGGGGEGGGGGGGGCYTEYCINDHRL